MAIPAEFKYKERPITVRCKFRCQSVTKKEHWNQKEKPGQFLYEAEFAAVYDGSPENAAFFEATPNGSLKIATYKEDHFQPGVAYYIDIVEA